MSFLVCFVRIAIVILRLSGSENRFEHAADRVPSLFLAFLLEASPFALPSSLFLLSRDLGLQNPSVLLLLLLEEAHSLLGLGDSERVLLRIYPVDSFLLFSRICLPSDTDGVPEVDVLLEQSSSFLALLRSSLDPLLSLASQDAFRLLARQD